MIIRSGLIRNRDGVDPVSFAAHWREVHGPLVTKIDGLRAYSQNLVVERLIDQPKLGMHRIDGISQLYFNDMEAMKVSMASPEQDACIADLRGFLSEVTIIIQSIGEHKRSLRGDIIPLKSIFLLNGNDRSLTDLCHAITATFSQSLSHWQFRLNPVSSRQFYVDRSIPKGQQIVDGVLELRSETREAVETVHNVISQSPTASLVDGFIVDESVVKGLEHA